MSQTARMPLNQALIDDLQASVDGEVRFGNGDRAMYAADASNYREVPLGVVIPRSVEDIAATIAACARHGASVVHRGGGTALAGQTVSHDSVVIDSSKYCNQVVSLDPEARLAVVEPGCNRDVLCDAGAPYGLMFGPDPATHNHNTLGGMLGNNSCGTHSVFAGRTSDNVRSLEILTYDGVRLHVGATSEEELHRLCKSEGRAGEIYQGLHDIRDRYADEIRTRFPKIPRRVSGYNLYDLLPEQGTHIARALVGSESSCVTILRATLDLLPDPPKKVILLVSYDSIMHAADDAPRIRAFNPMSMEAIDDKLIGFFKKKKMLLENLRHLPEGHAWYYIQFGGETTEEASARAHEVEAEMTRWPHVMNTKLLDDPKERQEILKIRESGLGATAWVPGMRDTWEGWEDSAVHPDNLGAYIRDFQALFDQYGYEGSLYGHFGDGLIHTRIDSGLHSEEEVIHFRRYLQDAAELVVRHGGTLSGEHGVGRSKAELLPIMFGPRLIEAFQEFKTLWDPAGKMNPGKVVWPKPITTDLRYGPTFEAKKRDFETVFHFPESQDSFGRAVMRCVGVGECRKHEGGTMCPSYRGTMDEKHTTRGRARLLQEMLEAGPIENGWQSEEVRESLELCLSCKACKTECPVNVDMAVYRAEFMHHHYKGKLLPLAAYGMGLVHRWAPLVSRFSWLMNFITQTPGLSALAKLASGVHQKRDLPKLAASTFRSQWEKRAPAQTMPDKPRALLWADTFNNHFTPEPLIAAAEVLERCGYEVALPRQGLCCGRPYYDFGRLTEAKAMLANAVEFLAPMLDERTWLVGIEPSCLSVFHEELLRLFPDDARAKRIAERTMTLGAFLKKHGHAEIHLEADVAIHGHCHHKSVLGIQDEIDLLQSSGRKVELLDDGCCGMAGSFGYEKEKYDVSAKIAEKGIVKHLAATPAQTIVSADGFSCRHQIAHFTDRKTITLPELLRQAMH